MQKPMRKLLTLPLPSRSSAAMFAYAPFMILDAPYESTMGLVQKIFYFHVPCGMALFLAAFVSGIGSAVFLFTRKPWADRLAVAGAELAVVFGLIVLVTGPLWARKAWGVWWLWDARLTSTLVMWLIFDAYLLLRRYGGPGSDRLGGRRWRSSAWPTCRSSTGRSTSGARCTRRPRWSRRCRPGMRGPFWFCVAGVRCWSRCWS